MAGEDNGRKMVPVLSNLRNRLLAKTHLHTKNGGGKSNGSVDINSGKKKTNIVVDPDTCNPTTAWKRLRKALSISLFTSLDLYRQFYI